MPSLSRERLVPSCLPTEGGSLPFQLRNGHLPSAETTDVSSSSTTSTGAVAALSRKPCELVGNRKSEFAFISKKWNPGRKALVGKVRRRWQLVTTAQFVEPHGKDGEQGMEHLVDRFLPAPDHPYGGMSHPVAQCAGRCNVDVKCLLPGISPLPGHVADGQDTPPRPFSCICFEPV